MTDALVLDLGLLLLRLALAFTFFAHATQKLLGWFSGGGLEASVAGFERMGQHPGKPMVVLAAVSELTCCALLLLGLAMPLGVAIGLGTMLVAGTSLSRMSSTYWNAAGGGEYPFFIGGVLACLVFLGAGSLSLDAALNTPWTDTGPMEHLSLAAGAVSCGVIAAVPPILRGRRHHIGKPPA